MKRLVLVILVLFSYTSTDAQLLFDSSKNVDINSGILVIPKLGFGYSSMKGEFLRVNDGLMVTKSLILPEIYLGGVIVSDGWFLGFSWGFLQHTLLLEAGVVFYIKIE